MLLSWLIAVLLAAASAFISNLGVTLQKLHHIQNPKSTNADAAVHVSHDDHYTGSVTWRLGLALVIVGSLFDLAALRFGPQSLVAPLGSLTLVSNVLFARLLLAERVELLDVLATGLIIVGSSLAVAFGKHEQPEFTTSQLFENFARTDFLIYSLIVVAACWTIYSRVRAIELIEARYGSNSINYLMYRGAQRFAYPALAGIIGAQSVLFAKCSIELIFAKNDSGSGNDSLNQFASLNATDSGSDVSMTLMSASTDTNSPAPPSSLPALMTLLYPQTWLVIGAMFLSIFLQIKFLNDGLKRFSSTYSIPVFQAFWILVSVVSGMIFYQEYLGMSTANIAVFCLGVIIAIVGVVMLTSRDHQGNSRPTDAAVHDSEGEDDSHHDSEECERESLPLQMSAHDHPPSGVRDEPFFSLGSVSAAKLKAILDGGGEETKQAHADSEHETGLADQIP